MEVAVDAQVDHRFGKADALHDRLVDFLHLLDSTSEGDHLLAHLQEELALLAFHRQHTAMAVEGSKDGTVAIL